MSTNADQNPNNTTKSPADERNLVSVDPHYPNHLAPEERLAIFWKKYGLYLAIAAAVVIVALAGRYLVSYLQERKDAEISDAYISAKTDIELRDFVLAYANHPLVGAAQLRIADNAYATGRYDVAATAYEKAASLLPKNSILAQRALLGNGIAQIEQGQITPGRLALKKVLEDNSVISPIRAEAGHSLVALAVKEGRFDDARLIANQVFTLDAPGTNARRILELLSSIPQQPQQPAAQPEQAQAPATPLAP